MMLSSACERALSALEPTPGRAELRAAAAALDAGAALPTAEGTSGSIISFALSWLRPEAYAGWTPQPTVDLFDSMPEAVLERWVQVMERHSVSSVIALLTQHKDSAGVAANAVLRLLAAGRADDALRVARTIPWWKKTELAVSLVHLGIARRDNALIAEAVAAVVDTRSMSEHCVEIEALRALLERMRVLPADHPSVERAVERAIALHNRGRSFYPRVFLGELEGALVAATLGEGPGWLAIAEKLRAILGTVYPATEAAIQAARVRQQPPPLVLEPRDIALELPLDDRWRTSAELSWRARGAMATAAHALANDDLVRFFEAIAIALDPAAMPYEERVAAWRASDAAAKEALLVELFEHEPTPETWWCAASPVEVWEALAASTDAAQKDALEILFRRDLVSRAFGNHREPGSIAAIVVQLAARFDDTALAQRLIEALTSSARPGVAHRLFDALEALAVAGWPVRAPELPDDRRWAGWALAGHLVELSLDALRARFGEPPPEALYRIAAALARAGRFEDAMAMTVHPATAHVGGEMAPLRPPPTQDALLAIAESSPALTSAQKKKLLAAMRKAPKGRDRGSQAQYKKRLARIEDLCGAEAP